MIIITTCFRICKIWLIVFRCTTFLNMYLLLLLPISNCIGVIRRYYWTTAILKTGVGLLVLTVALAPLAVPQDSSLDETFICKQETNHFLQTTSDAFLLLLALLAGIFSVFTILYGRLFKHASSYSTVKQGDIPGHEKTHEDSCIKLSQKESKYAAEFDDSQRRTVIITAVVFINIALKLPLYVIGVVRRFKEDTGFAAAVIILVFCCAVCNPVISVFTRDPCVEVVSIVDVEKDKK